MSIRHLFELYERAATDEMELAVRTDYPTGSYRKLRTEDVRQLHWMLFILPDETEVIGVQQYSSYARRLGTDSRSWLVTVAHLEVDWEEHLQMPPTVMENSIGHIKARLEFIQALKTMPEFAKLLAKRGRRARKGQYSLKLPLFLGEDAYLNISREEFKETFVGQRQTRHTYVE